ncbi:MAG: putative DNA binding domain-containing protein [Clostridia bacterium]|nr:putative DNA binding domain-containing protein [Clostridia bacterium]
MKRVLNDGFEKSLVAFLNTKAGTIYIGVEDDGSVTGVENTDEVLKRIADIITTQILPNPQEYIELGTKFVDGKQVVEVKVNKGNALYYIKKYGRSANGCYMRIGTSNRSMTEEQIEKQFVSYLYIPEKTMVEKASPRFDLTFSQFKTILTFKDVHYNETAFEQNYNLRNSGGQYNYLAFLLSDQNDTSIKVVRFRGKDKTEFISRKEFPAGCIFKQMDDALDYALNILNIVQTNITASERVDTPYFDEAAFREAWYNAVCHNLWVEQTPPAIYGFADRVEIISHGLLKRGMTEEEFFAGVSRPVNDEFAKIFMQLHYMEQSGKGVPTVVKKYGKEAYHFGSSFIQCILPYNILDRAKADAMNGNSEQEVHCKVPDKVPCKITMAQQKVLNLIIQTPNITRQEISERLSISIRMVAKHIKALKDKGIIRRIGSDKTGYWEVSEEK